MPSPPSTLFLAAWAPDPELVRRAVAEAEGETVLALYRAGDVGGIAEQTIELAAAVDGLGPEFRRRLHGLGSPDRFWEHVAALPELTRRRFDRVVALDGTSDPTAQRLQAEQRAAPETETAAAPATGRAARRLLGSAAKRVRELARRDLGEAPLAEPRPDLRARERAVDLIRVGDLSAAESVAREAAAAESNRRRAVDVLGAVARRALAEGYPTALAWDAMRAELALADRHLEAGRPRRAAMSLAEALDTGFHETLHFDGLDSPIAMDPAGYTQPLRDSAAMSALRAYQGRRRPFEAAHGRPTRLLVMVRGNAAFLPLIVDHFAADPGFEVRFEEFGAMPEGLGFLGDQTTYAEEILRGSPRIDEALEAALRPLIDWADVIMIDWCTALATVFSKIDPGTTRVIVRLHSYEAFTRWPHLIDFSRVDDLVFVSDHLRDLVVDTVPELADGHTRVHVIDNGMDLRKLVRPKPADARFHLGLIGTSKIVKDPRWAIEVLRRLRERDERYRLTLVGGPFNDTGAPTHEYALQLAADQRELGDAVRMLGLTDDVPGVLTEVGVILSSSVRESFHIGLVEGAASGAVPVVRDWPFFPGAAARLFPPEWIVPDPQAAAERVLALTQDEEVWRSAGAETSAYCIERWDWPAVAAQYERLLADG